MFLFCVSFRLLEHHSIWAEALLQALHQALQWGCALGMCYTENHWYQSTSGNTNTALDSRHRGGPQHTYIHSCFCSTLLCYHKNHTASSGWESNVSSACLSLLNDLILFHYTGTGHNNRPEAERSFQDKGNSSYWALRKSVCVQCERTWKDPFCFTFSRGRRMNYVYKEQPYF